MGIFNFYRVCIRPISKLHTNSPFIENGVVDYSGLQFAGVATAMVTALFGIAVTFVMKEGVAIRGPDSVKKRKVAKTMQEAISNPELDFPESSSTLNKLLAAMRTRTAYSYTPNPKAKVKKSTFTSRGGSCRTGLAPSQRRSPGSLGTASRTFLSS